MRKEHDKQGREILDTRPLEVPAGMRRPEDLNGMMRRLISSHLSRVASERGAETFEEANDFEIDDDDAELSPTQYELVEMKVDELKAEVERLKELQSSASKESEAARQRVAAALAKKEGAPVGAPSRDSGDGDSED